MRALDREHKFVRDSTILNSYRRNSRLLVGTDSPRNLYPGTKSLRRRGCLASSVDTSGDDAEPEHLADIHRIETCKPATGKSKQAWVHVVNPADDGFGARWTLGCYINLWRSSATCGDLQSMKKAGKPFCPTCTALWPPRVTQSIKLATRQEKGKV